MEFLPEFEVPTAATPQGLVSICHRPMSVQKWVCWKHGGTQRGRDGEIYRSLAGCGICRLDIPHAAQELAAAWRDLQFRAGNCEVGWLPQYSVLELHAPRHGRATRTAKGRLLHPGRPSHNQQCGGLRKLKKRAQTSVGLSSAEVEVECSCVSSTSRSIEVIHHCLVDNAAARRVLGS